MEESSFHFAKGCNQTIGTQIMDLLEVHNEALSENYMGMPSDVGIDKCCFQIHEGRSLKKSARMAGDAVIKAVTHVVPTYLMRVNSANSKMRT
jgi:hypothetical protein